MPSHKVNHTLLWIVIAFTMAAAIGGALLPY
jgi:hypothetical protein